MPLYRHRSRPPSSVINTSTFVLLPLVHLEGYRLASTCNQLALAITTGNNVTLTELTDFTAFTIACATTVALASAQTES